MRRIAAGQVVGAALLLLVLGACGSSGGDGPVYVPEPDPDPIPAPQPYVESIQIGTPICSSAGTGSTSGRTFWTSSGTIDVEPDGCASTSNYMRVWLQVNVGGAAITHYEWSITNWRNAAPHGGLAYHDGVIDIDLADGTYRVRSYGNSVRYDSASIRVLEELTSSFTQSIRVDAFTADGNSARAYFYLRMLPPEDDDPVPVLLVSNGTHPELSPDGTKFVFMRLTDNTTSARSEIYIANTNGTGVSKLTGASGYSDYCPQWVPDGSAVAFLRQSGSYYGAGEGELWSVKVSSGVTTRHTTWPVASEMCFYRWSGNSYMIFVDDGDIHLSLDSWPDCGDGWALRRLDGKSPQSPISPTSNPPDIAFFDATALGTQGLVTLDPVNLDEDVINNGGRFPWPCYNPSGSKIAAGADGGKPSGIYTMNANGTSATARTSPPAGRADHMPTWNKGTLLFVRTPYGGGVLRGDIYKLTEVN